MNGSTVLNINALSYQYGNGKKALNDVAFSVEKGECAILLGPNGAGKSTLFSLITRLYDARNGNIVINGFNVKKQSLDALRSLGVVFQQPTLDLDLNVLQNLHYHAALHGMSRREASSRIQEELERQGMFERRQEKVRQLNGGHRRRVEIARALLHRPKLILLDEPTVGLDVPSRKSIVAHIHELCKSSDIGVLWASHLIDEVYNDDNLIILHQGKIRATGTVSSVKQQANATDVAQAFAHFTAQEDA